jgi:hypothetical protein
MKISRAMTIGWIQFVMGLLAFPAFIGTVPETYLPWVAVATGVLTQILRWLNGAYGLNPLTIVGVVTMFAGIFAVPQLYPVVPLTWTPTLTVIGAGLTFASRWFAGQSTTDPAQPVNLLYTTSPEGTK